MIYEFLKSWIRTVKCLANYVQLHLWNSQLSINLSAEFQRNEHIGKWGILEKLGLFISLYSSFSASSSSLPDVFLH